METVVGAVEVCVGKAETVREKRARQRERGRPVRGETYAGRCDCVRFRIAARSP